MANYSFPQFNTTIISPSIDVNPIVKEINPNTMTISVNIVMIDSAGSEFGILLENVAVQNLTYTSQSLTDRVMDHLVQFEI